MFKLVLRTNRCKSHRTKSARSSYPLVRLHWRLWRRYGRYCARAELTNQHYAPRSFILFTLVLLHVFSKIFSVGPGCNQQRIEDCRYIQERDRIIKLLHRMVWHQEKERCVRSRLGRHAPDTLGLCLCVATKRCVLGHQHLV